jgi:hypothetical protein
MDNDMIKKTTSKYTTKRNLNLLRYTDNRGNIENNNRMMSSDSSIQKIIDNDYYGADNYFDGDDITLEEI